MKIKEVFETCLTDKAGSHNYHEVYEKVFVDPPKSILEVGVLKGHSLLAWATLFPYCDLTGVDITDAKFDASIEASGAKIVLHDSTDPAIKDILGNYDVIIDDGSHFYKHIIQTFENLCDVFEHAYVIEDVMGKECLDIIVDRIKNVGDYRIEVYPSKTKNVRVNTNWIWHNVRKDKETTIIDLYVIVVYKS